ncbi:hypothetical protein [Algoriphagus sediminis]|uniref:Outer membrane protein beta-barrel domain-containing protein n=1 Tax=Algoriphagus sediminis TaxID=3057113 RepID=A0ABT7YBY7_9BACT|nr:hypothetical protein [Algoriphagus sediminis]MDN3203998.1 hypothetical protein [Algoriphagus sediminis]
MKKFSVLIFLFLTSHFVFAQEGHENNQIEGEIGEEGFHLEEGRYSIAFVIGHTYLYGAKDLEGEEIASYVPMFAIDFNYYVTERFGIGLHTDILFETIFLEGADEGEVERENPVAPAVMFGYKLNKHFLIGAGLGAEFAGNETYGLNRISLEYGAEFRNGWEFFALLSQDFRWDIYDTTSLAFGLAKRF